jgi:hypothetical protein
MQCPEKKGKKEKKGKQPAESRTPVEEDICQGPCSVAKKIKPALSRRILPL